MEATEVLAQLQRGPDAWNAWRADRSGPLPSVQKASLTGIQLPGADLTGLDLPGADLSDADLSGARLGNAKLTDCDLSRASLRRAELQATYFMDSRLNEAVLDGAELAGTDFTRANLSGASLVGARLFQAVIADTDLSGATGLDTCVHESSSIIDSSTLARSGGLPTVFLKGCGLPDWLIEAYALVQPGLTNEEIVDIAYRLCNKRVGQVVQISPLFISYSHADSEFVDELEKEFDTRGIRYWRDVRHATAGRIEKIIDQAIRLNPTVLLVLSQSSVESDWVQHEARVARRLELSLKRDVLCPVALDPSWKDCRWPERLREQIQEYQILDFSDWGDPVVFGRMMERLLRGLSLHYEPEQSRQ